MLGRLPQFPRALLLVGALLAAGCVTPAIDTASVATPGDRLVPLAVVALVDTGINPYHVDFRDESELAFLHPSTYLPGFPEDAVAINLTLDAEDLDAALEADAALWESLEARTVYWFPGTKVIGYSVYSSAGSAPGLVFDTGHGTMTASRAAGNAYSLCPECRIVMVQGFTGEAVTWASEQPWIDIQSNSWSPLVVMQQADNVPVVGEAGLADAFAAAASRHAVFGSAGNGVGGKLGVVGHPSFTRSTSGPLGVVSVGGHDNGEIILWSGSWPHIVADACANWAAVGDTLDEYSASEGGGTSSASPYAAGEAARLVLEARRIFESYDGVAEGARFASASDAGALAALGTSPLADGDFTLDELKLVLFRTAVARPVATEHDGDSCGATGTPYTTYPIAWKDIPTGVPSYALIGYGQISVESLEHALMVLRGEMPLPERALEDEWHAHAETLRETYNRLRET